MKLKKCLHAILVALTAAFLLPVIGYGQEVTRSVNKFQYGKFAGTWFTVVQGQKGDLLDTAHIILRLKNRGDVKAFNFKSAGLSVLRDVRGKFAEDFYEVEVPKGADAFEVLRSLDRSGEFEDAFFNVLLRVDATPNDPNYSSQSNLPKASAPNAWDISTGSSSIIVAVIDVGADYNHEDLAANKWSGTGYDFYGQDSDPYPYDGAGHGTCVAGIIAAATNNSLGVSGIAGGWTGSGGIRLMHLRAGYYSSYYGRELIDLAAASQATDSAAAWGAKVINMSFGGGAWASLESAINRAVNDDGVVVVASAGNYVSGQSTAIAYPAAYSNVIAVGATTESDVRKSLNDGTDEPWWGSCYGSQLWLMAPGIHVPTTDITGSAGYNSSGNYFMTFNGTSAAAPHVAATAALMRSVNSSLSISQIRTALRYSADKVSAMGNNDWTSEYGYGRLNTYRALKTHFGTLTASQTWSDYNLVIGNVTVPSGITLTVNSGATVVFVPGTSLTVNGTLNASGATFDRSGSSGSWGGITFNSGSGGSLNGCTIQHAGIAVTCNSVLPSISNCSIQWNSGGITLNNVTSTSTRILNNYIYNNSSNGISCYFCNYSYSPRIDGNYLVYNHFAGVFCLNSSPQILNCRFMNNANGLYLLSNSSPQIGPYNRFVDTRAIYAESQCNVYSYSTDAYSFSGSQGSLVTANYSANVIAQGDYWGQYPPNSVNFYATNGANIYYLPGAAGPYTGPLPKAAAAVNNGGVKGGAAGNQLSDPPDFYLDETLLNAAEMLSDGEYDEAKRVYVQEFKSAINTAKKKYLLSQIAQCYLAAGEDGFSDFVNGEVRSNLTKNDELYATTLELESLFFINGKDYDKAIANYEALRTRSGNDKLTNRNALFSLGYIHQVLLGDAGKAKMYFDELKAEYPNDPLTWNAMLLTGEIDSIPVSPHEKPKAELAAAVPVKNILLENYPNPFNPTTTISYELSSEGYVTLKIYDILGREVATLVNQAKKAGRYEVKFDASWLC